MSSAGILCTVLTVWNCSLTLTGNPIQQRQMQELPGFDTFLEKRRQAVDKGNALGLHGVQHVCGLTE